MESEGTPGKVMISEVTKNILERYPIQPYDINFKCDVEVPKFNLRYKGYLLEKKLSKSNNNENNNNNLQEK